MKKRGILNWKKIAIGAIAALILIGIAFAFIPKKPLSFSVVGDIVTGGKSTETAPRLFISGEHIHHWVIGVIIILVALLASYYSYLPTKIGTMLRTLSPMAGYMFGFGLILIIDQLPYLLGVIPWGT